LTTTGIRDVHPGRGVLLVCLAGVIWGTIGTAVQLIHQASAFSALTMGAYRAVAGVAALLVASLVTGRLRTCLSVTRHEWRRVTAVGVLTAAFQLLFFMSVVAIGVSTATVVCLGFAPVLLLVVTSVQGRRRPSRAQAFTVATAVIGLLFVSFARGAGAEASQPALGLLTAVGSGAAYALSAHVAGSLSRRVDALSLTTATMSVAAAVLVPCGLVLPYLRGEVMTTTDVRSWVLLAYLGVVTMAFAYGLLFAGLRSTPSGSAVVATLLEPVTAVLLAGLILHEGMTPASIVGAALILAAIASLGWQSEEPQPQ
jgi:drug/metabolite transporter, DME family